MLVHFGRLFCPSRQWYSLADDGRYTLADCAWYSLADARWYSIARLMTSPPRVWGKHRNRPKLPALTRFTPTRVGKTLPGSRR